MRVHREEGIASYLGPEPCGGTREGDGEASVGEGIGQPLSRERSSVPGADAFQIAEGNTDGRASASARTARRGREVSCPASGNLSLVRSGKARSRRR